MGFEIIIDKNHFDAYFKEVRNKYLSKEYTEHTYRTPFENFISKLNAENV